MDAVAKTAVADLFDPVNRSGSETFYSPRGIAVRRVFPGVPRALKGFGLPNAQAARLFNPWPAYFGPVYLLCTGLWRKAFVLFLLVTLLNIFMPDDAEALALEYLLREHYALGLLRFLQNRFDFIIVAHFSIWLGTAELLPVALLNLGVYLWLAGRGFVGTVCLFIMLTITSVQALYVPGLHLGVAPSLLWLLGRDIWPLLMGVAWYALVCVRLPVLALCAGVATGCLLLGVTLHGLSLPAVIFSSLYTTLGAMAVLDTYRKRVLLQRFWW